jgi:hypothetical protein
MGQLCDHGCHVRFTAIDVTITLGPQTLFTGVRAAKGLWTVLLIPNPPQANAAPWQQANAATTISPPSSNTSELLQYLHASLLSPRKSTWLNAIRNGHFTTWPGITASSVNKLLPNAIATALGHMDQKRKNYRTTREPVTTDDTEPFVPKPLPQGK